MLPDRAKCPKTTLKLVVARFGEIVLRLLVTACPGCSRETQAGCLICKAPPPAAADDDEEMLFILTTEDREKRGPLTRRRRTPKMFRG
jgi:hypothetical protein